MQSHPSNVILWQNNERNVQAYKVFLGSLKDDEQYIFNTLVQDEKDVHHFLFSISFKSPTNVSEEICIPSLVKRENGTFYFVYTDRQFAVNDYNNEQEMSAIADSVIDDIASFYQSDVLNFGLDGRTYRFLQ